MFTKVLRGALAGLAATGPMTVVMECAFRNLPRGQRQPLPPRQITARILGRLLPGKRGIDERQRLASTAAAHFGFGASMGAILSAALGRTIKPGIGTGVACGLLVWLANYAGLLPAMRLQPPPQHRSVRRNALMVIAHVVWGATFGWFLARPLRGRRTDL